ncbi:MAG: MBL fold metallo-hydrolase [Candidatus Nanoarchaeia archaeon]|nr:MBL fold metallo-hydrolase [Candidatus Nanoarchaeia archaeon]
MTKLTFYGGVDTIGGNKILLEDKGTKIFLDFGMNFKEQMNYFTEFMPMRKCACISDLIELGLLPDIKGIYRQDYCKHMNLDYKTQNSIDGLLVSHAHIDHIGYIHFLRKDIPVYVSPESKAVMDLFENTAPSGSYHEYSEMKPGFKLIKKVKGDGYKRADSRDGTESRDINVFSYENPFKIGSLTITPYRVDHSLPGATGYIIETSSGNLVYTGDLRFHGRHRFWSDNFVHHASKSEPVAVITEGTRISNTEKRSESYVQNESSKLLNEKKGIAIANFPIRDTDRLLTFYNTSVDNNRILVIEARQAMLLDLLDSVGVDELPKSNDKNIRIFMPKKSWGIIGRCEFPKEIIAQDYTQSTEKEYLERKNIITAEEIRQNQEKYLMFMNYFQLNNLIDIKPKKESIHIRSICEPFSDEMELDEKRVRNWLDRYGLSPAHQIHSSGHASGDDITSMIKEMNPKILYPIHTEKPEVFDFFKKRTKVKYGTEYQF